MTVPPRNPERSFGTPGFLAEQWLLWPHRVDGDELPARPLEQLATIAQQRGFRQHLIENNRAFKHDDIDAIHQEFVERLTAEAAAGHSPLSMLYRWVLERTEIEIEFDDGRPFLLGPAGALQQWAECVDSFDPDAFISLELAMRTLTANLPADAMCDFTRWPIIATPGDPDLRRLFARGLSDLHIHLKSLWPVPLAWQRVLRYADDPVEGVDIKHVVAYRPLMQAPEPLPGGTDSHTELRRERRLILAAIARTGSNYQLFRLRPGEVPFFQAGSRLPTRPRDILRSERVMLIEAWRHLLQRGEGWELLERVLDRYLLAKSLFRTRHLQTIRSSNPGLLAFDSDRKLASHMGRFGREETAGGGFSESRFRRNNGQLLRALLECGTIRRAELRIAPPSTHPIDLPRSYGHTLRAFDRLIAALQSESQGIDPDIDLRIGIHFKRASSKLRDEDRRRGAPPTAPVLRKLMEFDTETAALHEFRRRGWLQDRTVEKPLNAVHRISRIDLASPERGSGPWLAAPYVRLLRHDGDMLRALVEHKGNPYLRRWRALHRQGSSALGFDTPKLGLTCHAGEDYYTLVDGLWHIDSTLDTWRLGPGDGIGHALALSSDPALFSEMRLPRLRLPLGLQFDSLVWLHKLLRSHGHRDEQLQDELECWLRQTGTELYSDTVVNVGNALLPLALHEAKLDRLGEPLPVDDRFAVHKLPVSLDRDAMKGLLPADQLRLLDLFDGNVARRRAALVSPARIQYQITDIVALAQRIVQRKIAGLGTVVETNPSSNWRMEQADFVEKLPIFDLHQSIADGIRITVCTDNPGIYDICIENEYGLLFSGLLELHGAQARERVVQILESFRRTGMEAVNWPPPYSAGGNARPAAD